jgi:hypothetical protein
MYSGLKILIGNIKCRPFLKLLTRLEDKNLSYIQWPNINHATKVYAIGDSHCEFYVRCSSSFLSALQVDPYVVWLGPKTILGAYFSALAQEWANYSFGVVEGMEKELVVVQRYFVFSFGTIDIRTLFFQLTNLSPMMTEDELFVEFEKSVEYLFQEFILRFRERWPNVGLGIFEVIYCTDEPGEKLNSIRELNDLLRLKPFPTLGSYSDRAKWCDKVNQVIKSNCEKFLVDFLPVNRHLTSNNGKKVLTGSDTIDGAHVTDELVVDNIFSEILSSISGQRNNI